MRATQAPTRDPAAQPTAASSTTPSTQASPTAGASPTSADGSRTHTVVSGDTLSGIAEQYGLTTDEIQAANPNVSFDPLGLGEVLVIPPNVPHKAEAVEDTLDVDVFSPPRQDWLDKSDDYLRK